MKFIYHTFAIALLAFVLELFLPWWSISIAAFIAGYLFAENGWRSFFAGLLGIAILWLAMSLYIDASTGSILTPRIAGLFPTKTVPLLIVITCVVGGLVGGFASLTGGMISHKGRNHKGRK
jgi:hypothetical protein